jgi:hypothetical protein
VLSEVIPTDLDHVLSKETNIAMSKAGPHLFYANQDRFFVPATFYIWLRWKTAT